MKRLFHKKLVGLSIVLLFLLYFVGPLTLRRISSTPFYSIGMPYVSKFLGFCFWSFLLYLYGGFLKRISMSIDTNSDTVSSTEFSKMFPQPTKTRPGLSRAESRGWPCDARAGC